MLFNIFILFGVLTTTIWIMYRWKMRHIFNGVKNIQNITPSYPLIGNSLLVFNKNAEELFKILSNILAKSWDSAVKFWLGPICIVTVGSPDDITTVSTSPNCMEKHLIYDFLKVETGLLAAPVKIWKHDRKLLNPTFNSNILKSFIPIFSECSKILVSKLRKNINKGEFNVDQDLFACTLDMVCRTTLGYNMDFQNNKNMDYLNATHKFLKLINARFFKVWLYPEFIYKLTKAYKEECKTIEIMINLFNKIINDKRKEFNENLENEGAHITDEDIEYKKPQFFLNQIFHLSTNNRFTEKNIMHHIQTIVVAGTETSAVTVSFLLLMLAIHPEIQERVYAEIQEYYTEDDLDYSYLSKLVYTEMVIKESQRLNQSSPYIARVTSGDVELKNCTIPTGVFVLISLHHLHRNPNVWGPNADKFNPDNFLPENIEKRHPSGFIPFGVGPRACIGLKYAMLSMKILLVELMMNYKFKTTLKLDEFRYAFDITLKLANGFSLSIEKREKL